MGTSASRVSPARTHSPYGCSAASSRLISSSGTIRPCAVSTRNIRPGIRRPRSTISDGSIGSTPDSLASTMRPAAVRHQRPGRRPLRSSTAPSRVPSVNVTQAGPSHGSMSEEWNSAKARTSSGMSGRPCHASGIVISTACGRVRPARCSSSSTSSRVAESDASGVHSGNARDRSPGIASVRSSDSRACMRLRLPRIVLISPLCAMWRNGCARSQAGNVLVENRECTTARALSVRGSVRSG